MAPRKKRGAPTSTAQATARSLANTPENLGIDVEADEKNMPPAIPKSTPMPLASVFEFYRSLLRDIECLDLRADGFLWFYHCVGVAAINVVMYDLNVQTHQLALLVWSGLWIGRHFFLALVVEIRLKRRWGVLMGRSALLTLFTGTAAILQTLTWGEMSHDFAIYLGNIVSLDAISITLEMTLSRSSPLPFIEVFRLTEVIFVAKIFSTQYNQRLDLIFDHFAVVVILGTMTTHHAVVVGVKRALMATPWIHEEHSTLNDGKQRKVVETISHLVGFDPNNLTNDLLRQAETRYKDSKANTEFFSATCSPHDENVVEKLINLLPKDPPKKILVWIMLQSVTVSVQVFMTATVVHSWELCTLVMCTSIHLLLQLLALHTSLSRSCSLCTGIGGSTAGTSENRHGIFS